MIHTYQRLRDKCLTESTRPFLARGASIIRCHRCLLGRTACICPWRAEMHMGIDIILLMHRDEVFKPTNTGRLIADVFPANTHVFPWSRTQPPAALLALLADPARYPVVVFPPGDDFEGLIHNAKPELAPQQKLTLVLLDGTWKQARKMFKTSRWLHDFPVMVLNEVPEGQYAVRHAATEGQLATAEAAAALLVHCEEPLAAQLLADYFHVFNQHYVATRMNTPLVRSCHHLRLEHRLSGIVVASGTSSTMATDATNAPPDQTSHVT